MDLYNQMIIDGNRKFRFRKVIFQGQNIALDFQVLKNERKFKLCPEII